MQSSLVKYSCFASNFQTIRIVICVGRLMGTGCTSCGMSLDGIPIRDITRGITSCERPSALRNSSRV